MEREYPTIGLFLLDSAQREEKPVTLSGINHLSQPIEPTTLKYKLNVYLQGRSNRSNVSFPYASVRILIVEDEENIRILLADLITSWGYTTETAEDGVVAMKKIKSFRPDIVISDMQMPRMDGLELLQRTHSKHPEIGFFILTGFGSIEGAVLAVKTGALNYHTKPVFPESLKAELQAYLDARQPPLRVFLCHSSTDKIHVRKLSYSLQQDRIDAWLDDEKLLPGQNWDLEIKKAVKTSDVVIVCLSQSSIDREGYVQKEIRLALDVADEKPEGTIFIIPAKLEECLVPDRLQRWQWVNLFEPNGYPRLLAALRKRAGTIPLKLSTPS